jgi:hypothetical protein
MAVCGNKLWIGTQSQQKISTIPLRYESNGCEVWHYDGENLEPSVKDNVGEKGNGFDNTVNMGAWSMIEYPVGSGHLVVGTYTLPMDYRGCEVWIRRSL